MNDINVEASVVYHYNFQLISAFSECVGSFQRMPSQSCFQCRCSWSCACFS